MDYSGHLASIQQQLAASADMDTRRGAVVDALRAAPGEAVLEIGCGAGLCLSMIADAVGRDGRAVGVDISQDQIAAAENLCGNLPQIQLHVSDARSLPIGDAETDATVSMQVLEYIADVEAAIAELARVTRPGGRFVNVATNWGSLFWNGGDPTLTATVLEAWDQHCPHPNLPVALPTLLNRHAFEPVIQHPVTIANRRFHPNSFSWGAAHLMAAYAESIGAIDSAGGSAWIKSLEAADRTGTHFVSLVPMLTFAPLAG